MMIAKKRNMQQQQQQLNSSTSNTRRMAEKMTFFLGGNYRDWGWMMGDGIRLEVYSANGRSAEVITEI
jgi:signal transduction histidine kinase